MKQRCLDLKLGIKRTRKQELLAQMDMVVLWAALVKLITLFALSKCGGCATSCLRPKHESACKQAKSYTSTQSYINQFPTAKNGTHHVIRKNHPCSVQ